MLLKLKYVAYVMIFSGFLLACFQNTIKSFKKELQLIELTEDDSEAQDGEEDNESLKKEWNDDLFSEYDEILLTNYYTSSIRRMSNRPSYFSFIKTILTPPPRDWQS